MVWVRSPVYFYERKDTYYFSRAVPGDFRYRFNKKKVEVSLRTKSEGKAAKSAAALSDRLERYWDSLRMEQIHLKELGLSVVNQSAITYQNHSLSMDDVLDCYHRLKGADKNELFFKACERSIRYLKECLGDRPIEQLQAADAGLFRDYLFDKGLSSSSVKRVFSTIRAIVNLSIRENGLGITNPFAGTFIPDDHNKVRREPIPAENITAIQHLCREIDDEPRWLIALISDTGMRLVEAAGLLSKDIVLDTVIPHINLREHTWRSLKTSSSRRKIPLVGASFRAATRIKEQNTTFAFPKYCNEQKCNSTSASAALNKWLKPRVPDNCVIHSFRHSMRDRLRAIECPADIIDAIGGWSTDGVGQSYGKGYDLTVLGRWMEKIG
ncbi:MAG: tyrosine-type recombinase/integrase [Alphaproteobacteria bacterium]|jgi:integrase|nr:tyrosine-type recombinase/integrase [Alphaproteobacteria bacterium]